jgi:hypothetical protein
MQLFTVNLYIFKLAGNQNYILNEYTINIKTSLLTVITHTKRNLDIHKLFNICFKLVFYWNATFEKYNKYDFKAA